jgi:hypothetical protein
MTRYDTNPAAEFYVLSMLHRIGAEAPLTLGNKKSIDIFIVRPDGPALTLDVKGLAGPYDWPADNIRFPAPKLHYIALLSFEGEIANPLHAPNVWILPANAVAPFIKKYKSRTVVSRAPLREKGEEHRNNWAALTPTPDLPDA